jgi:hypothetical protein
MLHAFIHGQSTRELPRPICQLPPLDRARRAGSQDAQTRHTSTPHVASVSQARDAANCMRSNTP